MSRCILARVQVQPDLTHLAFSVDSLEGFARHLDSLGLKFSDGPTMRPGGGGFAFIDAPEGYEIELIELPKSRARWPSSMQHRQRIGLAHELGVQVQIKIQSPVGFGVVHGAGHQDVGGVMVALGFDQAGVKGGQFGVA